MPFTPSYQQGWKKAALFNPENGDTVQVNDIDHSISGIGWEEIINENSISKSMSGFDASFQLGTYEQDGIALIREWVENQTPVMAVVAGDTNVQWYEAVPITQFKEQPQADRREGDMRWSLALEKAGGRNLAIYNNVNLLHQVNLAGVKVTGFADANGDGIADGYFITDLNDPSGLAASTFSNGVQTIEMQTGRTLRFPSVEVGQTTGISELSDLFSSLYFPISGINMAFRLSFDVSSSDIRMQMQQLSWSSILSTETKDLQSSDSDDSLASTTPANIFSIHLEVKMGAAVDQFIDVSQLALRTDGKTDYVAG